MKTLVLVMLLSTPSFAQTDSIPTEKPVADPAPAIVKAPKITPIPAVADADASFLRALAKDFKDVPIEKIKYNAEMRKRACEGKQEICEQDNEWLRKACAQTKQASKHLNVWSDIVWSQGVSEAQQKQIREILFACAKKSPHGFNAFFPFLLKTNIAKNWKQNNESDLKEAAALVKVFKRDEFIETVSEVLSTVWKMSAPVWHKEQVSQFLNTTFFKDFSWTVGDTYWVLDSAFYFEALAAARPESASSYFEKNKMTLFSVVKTSDMWQMTAAYCMAQRLMLKHDECAKTMELYAAEKTEKQDPWRVVETMAAQFDSKNLEPMKVLIDKYEMDDYAKRFNLTPTELWQFYYASRYYRALGEFKKADQYVDKFGELSGKHDASAQMTYEIEKCKLSRLQGQIEKAQKHLTTATELGNAFMGEDHSLKFLIDAEALKNMIFAGAQENVLVVFAQGSLSRIKSAPYKAAITALYGEILGGLANAHLKKQFKNTLGTKYLAGEIQEVEQLKKVLQEQKSAPSRRDQ